MKKKIVGTIIVIAFIGLSYYGWNQSKPIDSDIKLQNIEALAQAEIPCNEWLEVECYRKFTWEWDNVPHHECLESQSGGIRECGKIVYITSRSSDILKVNAYNTYTNT
ncbi:NVEALA domain-containing protein [Bacteroides fragilis]|uniref:NVEALA domain-containing protein n=1 Tax=Bacteroides fragilis TaxID=817 RepID=UPI0020CB5648|nr:NVEALA domain-containing protein [Bacteroides fragilis]